MFATLMVLTLMFVAMPLAMAEDSAIAVIDNSASAETTDSEAASNLISANPTTETLTQSVDVQTTAEINDDLSEDVSGFQVGMAKFGLWFTFNQEKKAEKELKIARLELIRARIAAKNNDSQGFDNALAAHDALIDRIKTRLSDMDGETTKEGVRGTANKLVGLERAIEVHETRIQKLNDILSSDSNLSEEQIAKIQARLDKVQSNTDHLKEVEADKKEKLKTKLMAVGDMTEEDANAEIQNIEKNQSLDAVKKLIAEKRIENAEKFLEKLKERTATAEAKGKDTTKAEERITAVEKKIAEAKTLVDSGQFNLVGNRLKQAENDKREASKESFAVMKENREQIRANIKDARGEFKDDKERIKAKKAGISSDDSTETLTETNDASDDAADTAY